MDFKESCYVKRARSTQMAFQNRRAGLEIFHKKNIVRSGMLPPHVLIKMPPFFRCRRCWLLPRIHVLT